MKIEIEDREQQLLPHHWELMERKIQLMVDMHKFAMIENEGSKPNWKKPHSSKFGLVIADGSFSEDGVHVEGRLTKNSFIFGVTVNTYEIAEKMKEQFGDRILEIYNKQI